MSREAFEKWWLNSVFQHIGVEDKKFASDVWQAACEYQRESDAGICDRFAEREMHPAECADAIRANKGE